MTPDNETKIVVITEEMLAEQTYLSEHFKVGDETTEDRINELAQQYAQGADTSTETDQENQVAKEKSAEETE